VCTCGSPGGGTRKHTGPTAGMLHCQKAGACCVWGLLDSPKVGVKVRVRVRVSGIRVSRALNLRTIEGAGILRNADCGKLSRGNLQKIKCGVRNVPQSTPCRFSAFRSRKIPHFRIIHREAIF